jgi:hypothetical protein
MADSDGFSPRLNVFMSPRSGARLNGNSQGDFPGNDLIFIFFRLFLEKLPGGHKVQVKGKTRLFPFTYTFTSSLHSNLVTFTPTKGMAER